MATQVKLGNGLLSATLSPLLSDTPYYYTVQAFNGSSGGVVSSVVTRTTLSGSNTGNNSNNILLVNGRIYEEGTKIVIAGVNLTAPTEVESADGTVVTTVGPIIYDGFLNQYRLTSGAQIAINGAPASSTSSVQLILYFSHTVYYENTSSKWFTLSPLGVSTSVAGDPRNPVQTTQGRITNTTGGQIVMTDGSILSNTTTN